MKTKSYKNPVPVVAFPTQMQVVEVMANVLA
jgi:hypothetical protein